jgi:hypothetical protein
VSQSEPSDEASLQPVIPGPERSLAEGVARLESLLLELTADQAVIVDLLAQINEALARLAHAPR